jgi:antitoxin (DNA-binding transcriptional repressor) of toxin-antitoxin stability system
VEHGEEIILSRSGEPIAKIIPFRRPQPKRKPGVWAGRVAIHEDFDELPDDVRAAFEGELP